jgi:small-conductance mechanosensitive channel
MLLALLEASATEPFSWGVVVDTLRNMVHEFLARIPYLVLGLIVFVTVLLISRPVANVICRAGNKSRHDNFGLVLSRITKAVFGVLALLLASVIIFPAFRPGDLVAGLGITSVAIGFAFKEILQNFFAGILILWREPFRIGDEIVVGNYEGVVEEINTRSTRLKTYNGERAVIPNAQVYTNAVLVRTAYEKRRARFMVGIGYPDDLNKAREVIARVVSETEGVLPDPGPWVYLTELAPSSVNFTVYFWTGPQQSEMLRVSDRVASAIKLALDDAGIDMPYPHTVVVMENGQRNEGAPELGYARTKESG